MNIRTHDPQTLRDLAEFGEPHGHEALLASVRRRLRRHRLVRLAAIPVVVLTVAVAVPTLLERAAGPRHVQVVGGAPPDRPAPACTEGNETMPPTRLGAAALLGAATLLGCTDGDGANGPGDASDPAAPVVLELSGDLEGSFAMTVEPVEWVSRDSDEAALRAWEAGELELPRMRFVADDHSLILSWPTWDEHRDPSRVAMTFRFGDYLNAPSPDQCEIDLTTGDPFTVRGTIACAGLRGVKPGADEAPAYDMRASVDFEALVCVDDEAEDGSPVCRHVQRPDTHP